MKKHQLIKNILVLLGAFVLCGCSSLKYSGADFDKSNVLGITTDEMLYFTTYKKNIADDVSLRIGITKTQSTEINAIYLGFINNTEYPYVLTVEDIAVYAGEEVLPLITAQNFLTTYYDEQNQLLMASQAMAPTIKNIANIANNFQGENQTNVVRSENNTTASIKQLENIITNIKLHSLTKTVSIPAGESQYYYIFVQNEDIYPIKVLYKNLTWEFSQKSN